MDNALHKLWDKFEYKVLLSCTTYKDRLAGVEKELSRVGISNFVIQWDVSSPLKPLLQKTIHTDGHLKSIGPFSCCLSHYKAIKTAFDLGYKSMLIMEDDIRFRKNLDDIVEALNLLPNDYDYAQFERVKPWVMSFEEYYSLAHKNIVNKVWRRFSDLRGGGCYALSRRAMQKMIDALEKSFVGITKPLHINDFYVSQINGINKYFAFPHVAVQAIIGRSNSNVEGYWIDYYKEGIKFEDYNMEGTNKPKFLV